MNLGWTKLWSGAQAVSGDWCDRAATCQPFAFAIATSGQRAHRDARRTGSLEDIAGFAGIVAHGSARRHDGALFFGRILTALALMVAGSFPATAATSYAAVCQLPKREIHFYKIPTVYPYSGSQIKFANTDVGYYPPSLQGLSLSAASATLPIDFPVDDSRIRFFYVLKPIDKYGNQSERLVGCLHFSMNGKSHVLSNVYSPEGNATPIIVSMFALDLADNIGKTLFIIIRYDTDLDGEIVYDLHAYGAKKGTQKDSANDWTKFELYKFTAKVFGDNSWVISPQRKEKSTHAYTNKAAVVKRLEQLGYLK